jgi:replicative DNA helicase
MNDLPALALAHGKAGAQVLTAWYFDRKFRQVWPDPDPALFFYDVQKAIVKAFSLIGPDQVDEARVLLELERAGVLARVAGTPGDVLDELTRGEPTREPLVALEQLRQIVALRRLRSDLALLIREIDAGGLALSETTQQIDQHVSAAASSAGAKMVTLRDAVVRVMQTSADPHKPRGVSVLFDELDAVTGGFRPEWIWMIAAETNYGKSTMATALYDGVIAQGEPALIISGEDPTELYARRWLARRAQINPAKIRTGKMSAEEWAALTREVDAAPDVPFWLDARGRKVEDLLLDVRAVVKSTGCKVVFFDYLQTLRWKRDFRGGKGEALDEAARAFVDLFRSLGVCGVMMSQITKDGTGALTKDSIRWAKEASHMAEVVLLGYVDKDGRRWINLDKNKDGP